MNTQSKIARTKALRGSRHKGIFQNSKEPFQTFANAATNPCSTSIISCIQHNFELSRTRTRSLEPYIFTSVFYFLIFCLAGSSVSRGLTGRHLR
jgi:hypothetical protein